MEITQSSGTGATPTYKLLDDIITILGNTKTVFWPFIESVSGIGVSGLVSYRGTDTWMTSGDEAGEVALQTEFSPYRHAGGVYSYNFNASGNHILKGQDNAALSFPANAACSFGVWILPKDITTVTLMAKYIADGAQEYKLGLDASSKLELEVFDEGAGASRIGASDTAVATDKWSFVCVTFDGADADASMTFYINGVADGTGNTETGSFDNMDDTAATLNVAAHYSTGTTPADEFSGRLSMPFTCGKELSANNVAELHDIGNTLLGLA